MDLRSRATVLMAALLATAVSAATDSRTTGITVGPPKVFDNRTLIIMLEQLERQLQNIRVVDEQKDKLLTALAAFQGARITDISRALSATGSPSPTVTTTEKPREGETALAVSERKTDQPGTTPSSPTLPTSPSSLSMAPTFGVKAEDLLTDQLNLSYQIMNVRMLLERALSDRLLSNGNPRLQVVLGFQIGIDPPKDAKDKAAFVEIEVTAEDGTPLSIVSVMPYEKTYNAYAIDRRSSQFGGAAVAGVVSLGYSERRGSETLYVYKDADTLALGNPKLSPPSSTVTFGWEFRPVLGRRSVSPGQRQMFAVLALPVADEKEVSKKLNVAARTFWRKYDSGKATTTVHAEEPTFTPIGTADALTTGYINSHLRPVIDDVQWRATDDKTAVVMILGKNLFSGTQVVLGSKTYESLSTGLIAKSDQVLELRTTVNELAFGDGAISGRYGEPVPLMPARPAESGIAINSVTHTDEPGRTFLEVEIVIQARDGKALTIPAEQPLIAVGSEIATNVYGQSFICRPVPVPTLKLPPLSRAANLLGPTGSSPSEAPCWKFTAMVSSEKLHNEPAISIKYPFRGDQWQASARINDPVAITGITRLGTGSKSRLAITGHGFANEDGTPKNWTVILDQDYKPIQITDTLMRVDVDAKILASFQSVVVQQAGGRSFIVKLPDGKPTPLTPSIDSGQTFTVKKESSVAVNVAGKDLKGIKSAKFEGKALTTEVSEDAKKITIYLTRDVTAKPGTAVILLETDDGLIPLNITIE